MNAVLEGVRLGGLVFVSHRGGVAVSGSWKEKNIIKCWDLVMKRYQILSYYLSLKSAQVSSILCKLPMKVTRDGNHLDDVFLPGAG